MLEIKQLWHLLFHLSEAVMHLFVVQHRWKRGPVLQRTQTSCSCSGQGLGVIYSPVSDPSLNFLCLATARCFSGCSVEMFYFHFIVQFLIFKEGCV